uniref:Uncharacterized protein n=1 Tax=Peronospora matthiolae TaxID=2874970 RepID=A0AAV1TE89_9STRA
MVDDVKVQELGRHALDAAAIGCLQSAVSRSAFVAIDTEMGGISCHDMPRPSVMDSIDERYAQYRASAKQFPLVQFGLALFSWHAESRSFHVETYQFPLFPHFQDNKGVHSEAATNGTARGALACPDRRFLVQAKCLQYIRAHGFDLNVWIDQGIGHLSHSEQQQEPCKSALAKSARPEILRRFDPGEPALITDETQVFLDQLTSKLKQRLACFDDEAENDRATEASGDGVQDDDTRRRGRCGSKKKMEEKNGRSERRDGDTSDCDGRTPLGDTTSANRNEKNKSDVQPHDVKADAKAGPKEDDTEEEDEEVEDAGQHKAIKGLQQSEEEASSGPDDDMVVTMKQFLLSPVPIDPTSSPCGVYVTEPLAPFRRHALVQHLREILPHALALDCKVDNLDDKEVARNPWKRRVRIVRARSKRQQQALVLADQQLADDEMRERNLSLIGFTAVLDVIAAAHKPIVGHNLLLDLMHCYEKFHGPLPEQCTEFQREVHAWLGEGGGIFDTKTLVNKAMQQSDSFAAHLTHTSLEHCFEVLSKHPFYGPGVQSVQPSRKTVADAARENGDQVPDSAQVPLQAHQAGYDAFMTGFVFLRVCSGLGVSNECMASLGKSSQGSSPSRIDRPLERLRNKLFVSHFLPTYVLHLPGPFPQPTPTPSRSRFVRMKLTRTRAPPADTTALPSGGGNKFCPALKTFHIKHCVGWTLNLQSATRLLNVHWEGQQCVYVELPSPEAVEQLLAVRSQTEERWGSTIDPMPSIGCVDLDRCRATDCRAEMGTMATMSVQSTYVEEKTRRKRKRCGMD